MRYVVMGKIIRQTYGLTTHIHNYGTRPVAESEFDYLIRTGKNVVVETITEFRCWHVEKSIYLDNLTSEYRNILIDDVEYKIEKILPTDNGYCICYIDKIIRVESDDESLKLATELKARFDEKKEAAKRAIVVAEIENIPKVKVKDITKIQAVMITLKSCGKVFIKAVLRLFGFKEED